MRDSQSESYKNAGVDIEAGYEVVARIHKHIKNTMGEQGRFDHLGFGGLLPLNVADMTQPLLVSATDGVGTKLKLAFLLDRHDTVGIDCVAMCVNDVLCVGECPSTSWTILRVARIILPRLSRSSRGLLTAVYRLESRSWVAKQRKCLASIRKTNTIWRDSAMESLIKLRS